MQGQTKRNSYNLKEFSLEKILTVFGHFFDCCFILNINSFGNIRREAFSSHFCVMYEEKRGKKNFFFLM